MNTQGNGALRARLKRGICAAVFALTAGMALMGAESCRADASHEMGIAVGRVAGTAKRVCAQINTMGFSDGASLLGAYIRPGNSCSIKTELDAGTTYVFVGGGDDDAEDVDILVRNSAGVVVAQDTDTDPTPITHYTPRSTGLYTLTLKLHRARSGAGGSFCAMALLNNGGWTIPTDSLADATANCLATASKMGDYAAEHGMRATFYDEPNRWSLIGAALRSGEGCSVTLPDAGRHSLLFLAGGDSFARQVKLSLLNGDGHSLDEYAEEKPYAYLFRQTSAGFPYKLVLTNDGSQKPTFLVASIIAFTE